MEEYDDARFLGRNARGTVAVNVSCRVAALGSNPCGLGVPARPLDHQLYFDEPITQETYPHRLLRSRAIQRHASKRWRISRSSG